VVDMIARFVFPLLFLIFIVVYIIIYICWLKIFSRHSFKDWVPLI
jgi:hypothetical protein